MRCMSSQRAWVWRSELHPRRGNRPTRAQQLGALSTWARLDAGARVRNVATMKLRAIPVAAVVVLAGCGRVGLIHTQPRNEGDPAGGTGEQATSGPIAAPTVTGFDVCEAQGNTYERFNIDPQGRAGLVSVRSTSGYEICRAYDSNRNGRFETWQVLNDARPVRIAQSSTDNSIFDEYAVFPDPLRLDCPVIYRRLASWEELKSDACGLLARKRASGGAPIQQRP